MAKTKISPAQMAQAVDYIEANAADPAFIYKMQMYQLRDARKMFKNDATCQAKLDTIEANIKAKYKAALAVA